MSAADTAAATLMAAKIGVVGGVGGVVIGVVVERLLRLTGRLRFECSGPSLRVQTERAGVSLDWTDVEEGMTVQGVLYTLPVDLFNGKEVPTGLRNVRVCLVRADGDPVPSRPLVPLEGTASGAAVSMGGAAMQEVDVINIPPRWFVHLELHGSMTGEAGEAIKHKKWRRLEFVGELPKRPFFIGSKTYRKTITWPSR